MTLQFRECRTVDAEAVSALAGGDDEDRRRSILLDMVMCALGEECEARRECEETAMRALCWSLNIDVD